MQNVKPIWLTTEQMEFGDVLEKAVDKYGREVRRHQGVITRILESTCEFGFMVNDRFTACDCNGSDERDPYCDHSAYVIHNVNIWKSDQPLSEFIKTIS